MKVECAWCGRRIRGPDDSERVSYGICSICFHLEVEATSLSALEHSLDWLENNPNAPGTALDRRGGGAAPVRGG
jgi:hypothetical protein